MRALIAKLDQPAQGAGAQGNIWVVYLKNADAVKLATVLRAAYGGGSGTSGGSGGSPASTTRRRRPRATQPAGATAGRRPAPLRRPRRR